MEKINAYSIECGGAVRDYEEYVLTDTMIMLDGHAERLLMEIYSGDEQVIFVSGGDTVLSGRDLGINFAEGETLVYCLECGPYICHDEDGAPYVEIHAGGDCTILPIQIN